YAARRAVDASALLRRDGQHTLDQRFAFHTYALADIDTLVVDRVARGGQLLHAAQEARDVMRLGLAYVPKDLVDRAAALRLCAKAAVVDALRKREQIRARPLEPAHDTRQLPWRDWTEVGRVHGLR